MENANTDSPSFRSVPATRRFGAAGADAHRCALWCAAIAITVVLAFPRPALAQDKVSVAEGLFRDGRALMAKGDLAGACSKFAESQRLDPSPGTLLNLALCHKEQGKIATAWAEFLEAKRAAQTRNRQKVLAEAKRRAEELGPKVSYLTIVLAEKVPGISVQIDNVKLDAAALGAKIPVDPGQRSVEISAPGYQPLKMKVTIGAEHDMQTLNVPKLEKKATPTPTPSGAPTGPRPARAAQSPAAPPPPVQSHHSILPYVVGGVGLAALGVGTAFAFLAKSAYSNADSLCPSHAGCSQNALDKRSQAETRANIANVGLAVGVVGIGVGAVLWLTQSSASEHPPTEPATGLRSLRVNAYAYGSGAGISLSGSTF